MKHILIWILEKVFSKLKLTVCTLYAGHCKKPVLEHRILDHDDDDNNYYYYYYCYLLVGVGLFV
jgi:hypothetical protein